MSTAPSPLPLTPETALARFVDLWSMSDAIPEIVPILQCSEVDSLADLFTVAGKRDIARDWVDGHRAADPECDCQREAQTRPCEGCGAEPGQPCNGPTACP